MVTNAKTAKAWPKERMEKRLTPLLSFLLMQLPLVDDDRDMLCGNATFVNWTRIYSVLTRTVQKGKSSRLGRAKRF